MKVMFHERMLQNEVYLSEVFLAETMAMATFQPLPVLIVIN